MRILLIAATNAETAISVHYYEEKSKAAHTHRLSWKTTGVGLAASTYALAKLIENERPDLIIQGGIAGSFVPGMAGQTVLVKADTFGDLGVQENGQFKNLFDLNLHDANEFPFQNGWLPNPYLHLLGLLNLQQVLAVTVNEISTDPAKTALIQQKYSPVVESMEGASLHYVALMEKIPFVQIRSISNNIGERDKSKWKIKEAINSLNQQIIELITKLEQYNEDLFRL